LFQSLPSFVSIPADASGDQEYLEAPGWKFLDIPGRDKWIYFFQIQIRSNNFISKTIQTEDDLNASEDNAKAENLLMSEKIPNIMQ